jgi:hypothetical protein
MIFIYELHIWSLENDDHHVKQSSCQDEAARFLNVTTLKKRAWPETEGYFAPGRQHPPGKNCRRFGVEFSDEASNKEGEYVP